MSIGNTSISRTGNGRGPVLAAGLALFGALSAASCCVLPIALSIVGLGGSWLALFGVAASYREIILIAATVVGVALIFLAFRSRISGSLNRTIEIAAMLLSVTLVAAWTAPTWELEVQGWLLRIWAGVR